MKYVSILSYGIFIEREKMKHKTFYGYPGGGNLAFIFVYVSVCIIYYHRTLLIVD